MSRDQVAVRITNVSKNYLVYSQPRYWLADFMGFGKLLKEGRHYHSFWALRDIHLEIPRGGRVAIVGRNGAGKSTLLRIIAGNIAPSTGKVELSGHCEALMQLGAGFNPDFTGRQNILTALAYMNITGKEANDRILEIIDFSELDEFIDQPVRTYSAGMYLRLAFSVATVVIPGILIIDEILGAGDLYFQSKCLARMESLTQGPGTTVLFVSHDLLAAQRLCDTFVWIDRGRILAHGPGREVCAEYEASIRRQQEIRLRARNMRIGPATLEKIQTTDASGTHLLAQIRPCIEPTGAEIRGPQIHSIELLVRSDPVDAIRVGDAMDDASGQYPSFIINDCGQGGWSSPMQHDGRHLRETRVTNMGSGSRFALLLPYDDFKHPSYEASIAITYRDSSIVEHKVEINAGTAGLKTIGVFEHTGDGIWKTLRLPIPRWIYATNIQAELSQNIGTTETEEPAPSGDTSSVPPNKRFGTGQVRIDHIRFLDAMGNEQLVLQHGKPATLEITFHAEDTSLVGSTMMCSVGFLSHDGLEIAAIQSLGDGIMFTISLSGKIRMVIDNLLLCNRGYRISVGLFSQMDLNGYNPHFTVSPFLYDLLARSYDIAVEGAYMAENWIFRPPVRWEADGLVSSSEG